MEEEIKFHIEASKRLIASGENPDSESTYTNIESTFNVYVPKMAYQIMITLMLKNGADDAAIVECIKRLQNINEVKNAPAKIINQNERLLKFKITILSEEVYEHLENCGVSKNNVDWCKVLSLAFLHLQQCFKKGILQGNITDYLNFKIFRAPTKFSVMCKFLIF